MYGNGDQDAVDICEGPDLVGITQCIRMVNKLIIKLVICKLFTYYMIIMVVFNEEVYGSNPYDECLVTIPLANGERKHRDDSCKSKKVHNTCKTREVPKPH